MSPFRASAPHHRASWEHFGFEVADGVATVTLDRPGQAQRADLRGLRRPARPASPSCRTAATRACSSSPARAAASAPAATSRRSSASCRSMEAAGAARVHAHDRRGGAGRCASARCPVIAAVNGDRRRRRVRARAGQRLPPAGARRRRSRSSSRASGWRAPTWAPPTCCRGSSALGRATELLMLGDKVDAEEARARPRRPASSTTTSCATRRPRSARRLADGPALAYAATKCLHRPRAGHGPRRARSSWRRMTQALLMQSHDHGEFYRGLERGPRSRDGQGDERPRDRHRPRARAARRLRPRGGRRPRARRRARRPDRARRRRARSRGDGSPSSSTSPPATSSRRCAPPAARPTTSSRMQIFVTDVAAYKAALRRARPASGSGTSAAATRPLGLFGVTRLFDDEALDRAHGARRASRRPRDDRAPSRRRTSRSTRI